MASRQVRRLLQEELVAALNVTGAASDDDNDTAANTAVPFNPFDLLDDGDGDDGTVDRTDGESDSGVAAAATQTTKPHSKKKKKNRKGGGKGDAAPKAPSAQGGGKGEQAVASHQGRAGSTDDDIDKLVAELGLQTVRQYRSVAEIRALFYICCSLWPVMHDSCVGRIPGMLSA
jgi:hypothetical protein